MLILGTQAESTARTHNLSFLGENLGEGNAELRGRTAQKLLGLGSWVRVNNN